MSSVVSWILNSGVFGESGILKINDLRRVNARVGSIPTALTSVFNCLCVTELTRWRAGRLTGSRENLEAVAQLAFPTMCSDEISAT